MLRSFRNNFAKLTKTATDMTAGVGTWGGDSKHKKWATAVGAGGNSRKIDLWNIGMGPTAGDLTFYCPDNDPKCTSEQVSLQKVVFNGQSVISAAPLSHSFEVSVLHSQK